MIPDLTGLRAFLQRLVEERRLLLDGVEAVAMVGTLDQRATDAESRLASAEARYTTWVEESTAAEARHIARIAAQTAQYTADRDGYEKGLADLAEGYAVAERTSAAKHAEIAAGLEAAAQTSSDRMAEMAAREATLAKQVAHVETRLAALTETLQAQKAAVAAL